MNIDQIFEINISQADYTLDLINLNQVIESRIDSIRERIKALTEQQIEVISIESQLIKNDSKGAAKLRNFVADIIVPFFDAAKNLERGMSSVIDIRFERVLPIIMNNTYGFLPFISSDLIDVIQKVDLQAKFMEKYWQQLEERNPDTDFSQAVRISWTELIDPITEAIFNIFADKYSFINEQVLKNVPNQTEKGKRIISNAFKEAYETALPQIRAKLKKEIIETGKVKSLSSLYDEVIAQSVQNLNDKYKINVTWRVEPLTTSIMQVLFLKWQDPIKQNLTDILKEACLDQFGDRQLSELGLKVAQEYNYVLLEELSLSSSNIATNLEQARMEQSLPVLSMFGIEESKENFVNLINLLAQILLHYIFFENKDLLNLFNRFKVDLVKLLSLNREFFTELNREELDLLRSEKESLESDLEKARRREISIDRPRTIFDINALEKRIAALNNPEKYIIHLLVNSLEETEAFNDRYDVIKNLRNIGIYTEG